jgi:hypothetical protein
MNSASRDLVFNGAVVLLIGLLCGAPYGRAILRKAPSHIVHSWRVAHASLPIGATLMFAVAAILPTLTVTQTVHWLISVALIVSAYAFCFALPLAALTGHRGLVSSRPVAARLVHAGNVLGSVASLIAAVLLVYAAYVSL